jgi:hypothetical protein
MSYLVRHEAFPFSNLRFSFIDEPRGHVHEECTVDRLEAFFYPKRVIGSWTSLESCAYSPKEEKARRRSPGEAMGM